MKKASMLVCSVVIAGLFALSAQAQTNSSNYAEDFEGFALGAAITNYAGWYATESNSVIVATNYTAKYQGGTYPIAYDHTTATQVLKIENGVSNSVSSGGDSITNWMDTVLQPVFADSQPDPPAAGALAGVYFDTNGYPVVMHTVSNDANNVEWITIPDPAVQVEEGDWIRLTVLVDFAVAPNPIQNATRFYQVMINGTTVTNAHAFQTQSRTSGTNGSWFGNRAPLTRTKAITNVTVLGTGHMDDLVLTNALTVTAPTQWTITATANTNGTIDPEGEVTVTEGNSEAFTITPDSGYVVDDVVIVENGTTTTNNGITSYTFNSVSTNGSITASFVAETTYTITPAVVGSGTITPSDPQVVGAGSNSVAFTFDAVDGWMLDDVEIVENGATNHWGAIASYTFTNVMADGWITAYFVDNPETPTTNWFSETGITEDQLTEDRGDGMTRGEAWLASVDPADTNSVFRVTRIEQVSGTNYVEWVSVYVDTNLPPFGIWARTNLMDTTYDLIDTYPRVPAGATPVTNTWSEPAPGYPIYYRVAATNAPVAP